jgi:hypothetical protein
LITPDAFGAEDLVEAARELAVAVTNEKTDRLLPVGERHDKIPSLLGDPALIRIGGHAAKVDASRCQLDEEENVLAGDDRGRLRTQELRPGQLRPPRRRLDPVPAQDRPDRARRKRDAEANELTVDAPVASI